MDFSLAAKGRMRLLKTMNFESSKACVLAASLICGFGVLPASAQLPMMQEKEWLGYFTGVETNDFKFGVGADGNTTIKINEKKGDSLSNKLTVNLDFHVEQTMPDGKVVLLKVLPETLESPDTPTTKPKNTVIRGKVKGDAQFEVTVDEARGGILLGGRLLDPGTLPKDSLRFIIVVKIPNAYTDVKTGTDKKDVKAFEERIKDDCVQVTYADKKRKKLSAAESVDAGSKEVNGAGITAVGVQFSTYKGKEMDFTASPNSLLRLSGKQPGPLQDGFLIIWAADAAKDPKGAARLSIEIK